MKCKLSTPAKAFAAACVFMTGACLTVPVTAQATTITAVMQAPLRSLDPVITTAYIVRNFGYMIYDTLLALDADGKVQPQMVDNWKVSDDGKTYTFTLRDGLKWSDGTPVTAKDCVASIERWSSVDKMGQTMKGLMDDMKVVDDKTFSMHFKVKTSVALSALAKPSGLPAFMMPEKVAKTPSSVAITQTIGSGPFVFDADQYRPGVQAVFEKNKNYVPRSEPPNGLAGGKNVYVDEVKWISMPDTMTTVNAMLNKEIDFIETTPYDLIPLLEKDPSIELIVAHQQDQQPFTRFNFMYPPFNNKEIRRAAMVALNQVDVLQALVGNSKYYEKCYTVYGCGNPLANDAGTEGWGRGNIELAKKMLKDAGYDGTPVVQAALQKAGFKVDMQAMDWQTLLNRRASTKPPAEGGWNAFNTNIAIADAANPLGTFTVPSNGKNAWFGWPDVPEIEALRDKFARSDDPEELKSLAAQIQKLALDNGVVVPLGQNSLVMASSKSLSGLLRTYVPVLWNIKKEGK